MRTIIAGSREITDYNILCQCIDRCPFKDKITLVISGTARGVDQMGERWAEENNIPIQRFPANWEKYGRGAGPIRNRQMANNADALIVLMIPESRGSKNMYETAIHMGIKHIHREFYYE